MSFFSYRYGCQPTLDQSPMVLKQIDDSVVMLQDYLDKNYSVYGKSGSLFHLYIFVVIEA